MTNQLTAYIDSNRNAQVNYNLALEYDAIGQTASAISFYLRAAELSEDDLTKYQSLLKAALCFEKQGNRSSSVKGLIQQAICVLPQRPEAFFLLARLHEREREWFDCYTISTIALSSTVRIDYLSDDVEYPGSYGLLFEKGVAAWWIGRCHESRQIMYDLKTNYKLDSIHSKAVENNLDSIGYPKHLTRYTDKDIAKFRFPFAGLENIKHNFSQSYQDLFVLAVLQGKRGGTYLELGSNDPFFNNNTALLEEFDWKGVSIDFDSRSVLNFREKRKNTCILADATKVDYESLLASHFSSDVIDYLQLDCDPAGITFDILKRIPFDRYRFGVITYEHDYYSDPNFREKSRNYLHSKGYTLLAGDICFTPGKSYEDWWIHPSLFKTETITRMIADDKYQYVKDYLFTN